MTVVPGSPINLKITTKEDLRLAEQALKALPKPKLLGPGASVCRRRHVAVREGSVDSGQWIGVRTAVIGISDCSTGLRSILPSHRTIVTCPGPSNCHRS